MKQNFLRAVFICCLFVAGIQVAHAEIVHSFNTDIHLQTDSTLNVTETIVMDFKGDSRHGIYRDIQVEYERNNNTYRIYLKVLSITDANNHALMYKTSSKGRDIDIRIGDADKFITGVHTYKLHYTVLHAVNFFNGKPEVYWNATGEYWPFPIQHATARFYPPPGVNMNQLRTRSFVGRPGATQPASSKSEANDVVFYTSNLNAGEGLTFVVGLPKGSVVPPRADRSFSTVDATYATTAQKLNLIIHSVGAKDTKDNGVYTIHILDGSKELFEKQMPSLTAPINLIHEMIDFSLQVHLTEKIQVQPDPTDTIPEITKTNNQINFTPSALIELGKTSAGELYR